jgi:hypothetical protein
LTTPARIIHAVRQCAPQSSELACARGQRIETERRCRIVLTPGDLRWIEVLFRDVVEELVASGPRVWCRFCNLPCLF